MKKYTLLALMLLLSLALLLGGCNDWNDPPLETSAAPAESTEDVAVTTEEPTTEELTTEELTTEEITTEEPTTEEPTTEESTTEETSTEEIPEHTGDYSKPY